MSSYDIHSFKKWMLKKGSPLAGHCFKKSAIPAKLSLLGHYECIFWVKNCSMGFWLFQCRNSMKK